MPSYRFFGPFLFWLFSLGFFSNQFDATTANKGDLHYTKDGNLEINFEFNSSIHEATLKPTLFFEEERENRHVFNLDVCVNFIDTKNQKGALQAKIILCYKGNLPDDEVVKENNENNDETQMILYDILNKCTKNGTMPQRRGIMLNFDPPDYDIYSVVDQKSFRMNSTEFVRDPIRIPRNNMVPKFCLRLQMGRMPPPDEEVQAQREQIEEALRNMRFDAEARNLSDNVTNQLRKIPNVVLEVEDVTQEFMLRSVDFLAHPDARAPYQESMRLFGFYRNKTLEETTKITNITREDMISEKLYWDFVPKVTTDKNYHRPSWTDFDSMDVYIEGAQLQFVNLSFNGGNIFPCRTEWVDLEKFTMERDFYHPVIHEFFSPVHIAYTVGLVGWKNESERGFGPGYEKKGKFGPSDEDIKRLKIVLEKSEGFLNMEKRYKNKFGDVDTLPDDMFHLLEDYYTPLQLNEQQPLSEITVKQLVFTCGDHNFNLPHVASFVEGVGI